MSLRYAVVHRDKPDELIAVFADLDEAKAFCTYSRWAVIDLHEHNKKIAILEFVGELPPMAYPTEED